MKKRTSFMLPLIVTILFFGCHQSTQKSTNFTQILKTEFPKLLDRSEKLWYGKEWETIQNAYAGAVYQIRKKDNPEGYLSLCEVFINEARITGEHGHYYPAALDVLATLEQKENLTSEVNFQLLSYKATVLLSQHEFQKALEAGESALKLYNYNAQVYGILVDANVELGNYSEAITMADKMVSIRPDLRSYSRISYLREIHGDFDGAIEAMNMAVAAGYPGFEQSEWTRLTFGNLYETIGDLEQAASQYQTVLKNRENYPFAIAALANIEFKKGNHQKAAQLLKEASAIIPEVSFFEELCMLYKEIGEVEKVKKLETELFEMLHDDVESGHNMNLEYANIFLNIKNDPDTALLYALKEYEKRPKNIDVNKTLSMIYFQMEDLENAEKHLQVATKTKSGNPELLCLVGLIEIAKGHKEVGIIALKKSFELNPFQSHSLSTLGKNYILHGQNLSVAM